MRALPVLDLAPAAELLTRTAAAVRDDQLDAPTPCSPMQVRDLLAHLLVATRMSAAAGARREPAGEVEVPVLDDGRWRGVLAERADALAAARADPQAWSGATTAGGVTAPAQEAGRVAAVELVLHGWDLAVATGQPFAPDAAAAGPAGAAPA